MSVQLKRILITDCFVQRLHISTNLSARFSRKQKEKEKHPRGSRIRLNASNRNNFNLIKIYKYNFYRAGEKATGRGTKRNAKMRENALLRWGGEGREGEGKRNRHGDLAAIKRYVEIRKALQRLPFGRVSRGRNELPPWFARGRAPLNGEITPAGASVVRPPYFHIFNSALRRNEKNVTFAIIDNKWFVWWFVARFCFRGGGDGLDRANANDERTRNWASMRRAAVLLPVLLGNNGGKKGDGGGEQ